MKLNICSRESKLFGHNLDFEFITLRVNVYLVVVKKVHRSYISQNIWTSLSSESGYILSNSGINLSKKLTYQVSNLTWVHFNENHLIVYDIFIDSFITYVNLNRPVLLYVFGLKLEMEAPFNIITILFQNVD